MIRRKPSSHLPVQSLAEIPVAAIREHDNDVTSRAALDQLLRRRQRAAGRGTGKDAFPTGQDADGAEGFVVCDFDDLIHQGHVHRIGNEVVADAFDIVIPMLSAVHRGAHRVGKHTLDGRILLLQISDNAGERAAAARV